MWDNGIAGSSCAWCLSTRATARVIVRDVNEPPVPEPANFSVSEASDIGNLIGSLVYADEDVGDAHTFWVDGTAGFTPFKFKDSQSDVLKVSAALNYEAHTAPYVFDAYVYDLDGLSGTARVAVQLVDANDKPTIASVQALSVSENALGAASAVNVSADDEDCCDAYGAGTDRALWGDLSWVLSGEGADAFALTGVAGTTRATLAVPGPALDYEVATSYELTVTVTDGGALAAIGTLDIEVIDENDPPVFDVPCPRHHGRLPRQAGHGRRHARRVRPGLRDRRRVELGDAHVGVGGGRDRGELRRARARRRPRSSARRVRGRRRVVL